jgi:hypothetical protein
MSNQRLEFADETDGDKKAIQATPTNPSLRPSPASQAKVSRPENETSGSWKRL